MLKIIVLCLLNSLSSFGGPAHRLPSWITDSKLSDQTASYVVCSHEGLDPEEIKNVAESKCISSASKLSGVQVKVSSKTIDSLTGVDSSEESEIKPIESIVKCIWIDRYLEKLDVGFRIWLRCRVDSVQQIKLKNDQLTKTNNLSHEQYKKGQLVINSTPRADKILLMGKLGTKAFSPTSTSMVIEIRESDEEVLVKKNKYKEIRFKIPEWKNADTLTKSVVFEK